MPSRARSSTAAPCRSSRRPSERDDVPSHLLSLVRKEMIRPDQPTYPDEEAFRFRHLLIRDAAYDSLPKETRAELHEAFADWLDRHATLVEQDEIVGYHLERAYRNRAELDSADPTARRASHGGPARLTAAGRGAEERGDVGAACGLLGRGAALLPDGDPQRLESLSALVLPLNVGRPPGRGTRSPPRSSALRPTRASSAFGLIADNTNAAYSGAYDAERARANIEEARSVFAGLGDELGLAWTEFSEVVASWMCCQVHGDDRSGVAGGGACAAPPEITRSPRPYAGGESDRWLSARCRSTRRCRQRRRCLPSAEGFTARADARRDLGKLLAMQGRVRSGAGRRSARLETSPARQACSSRQQPLHSPSRSSSFAPGPPTRPRIVLRNGIAELDRLGNRSYRGTTALLLADRLATRGAYEEASRWCAEVRGTLNEDDLTDVIGINAVEGFLRAVAGGHDEGEQLSARAVEVAATIDMYESKARAYEWHARTLALVGKPDEAREAAATALAIYEAKGDVARERLDTRAARLALRLTPGRVARAGAPRRAPPVPRYRLS